MALGFGVLIKAPVCALDICQTTQSNNPQHVVQTEIKFGSSTLLEEVLSIMLWHQ